MKKIFSPRLMVKICFLTIFFSLLLLVLFYSPSEPDYKSDHMHDWRIKQGAQKTFTPREVDPARVDQQLEQFAEGLLKQEHQAASQIDYQETYNELCTIYQDLCTKTTWNGEFSDRDTLIYQALMIYLIKQIDQRLQGHPTIRITLSKLLHLQNPRDKRGRAGHTHVKINTQRVGGHLEYREVLTHELGHILDLGSIVGSRTEKHSAFTEFNQVQWAIDDPSLSFYEISWKSEDVRKGNATYEDFVSGYAMKGIYEDFAETFNLYFNHHALFEQLAASNQQLARKYTYFEELFGGDYFKQDQAHLSAIEADSRPWDTTKISGS